MMRILTRYLAREIALATALVLVALAMLFGFFDLIHELGELGKGSYRLGNILAYVGLNMPGNIYNVFPVAALIGTLFVLARMTSHSELTVMRVSGLSDSAKTRWRQRHLLCAVHGERFRAQHTSLERSSDAQCEAAHLGSSRSSPVR